MRLKTLAGAYAGEIRDYPYPTAMAALRTGTAERVEDVPARVVLPTAERQAPQGQRLIRHTRRAMR